MTKEVAFPSIPSFDFNPTGETNPFEMITAGVTFEAPVISEPAPAVASDPIPLKFKVSAESVLRLEQRIAGIRNAAKPIRMSRRDWLVEQVKSFQPSITALNEAAMYAARRQEQMCGGNDGHGLQQNSNPFEAKSLTQSAEPSASKANEAGVVKCEHEVDEKTCSKCKGHAHAKAA